MRLFAFLMAVLLLAGCSKKPDTLVSEGYDEKEMDAAIARARRETDDFLKVLEAGTADSFSVKVPITDDHGTEHFWITDITYKDGQFHGKIGNDPGIVKNVKLGQDWSVKREDISDWMYVRGERIHGGYTIDPLLSEVEKTEAEALRKKLVR
jgi:uncharacterized protein YegJ (DUF2314 family)